MDKKPNSTRFRKRLKNIIGRREPGKEYGLFLAAYKRDGEAPQLKALILYELWGRNRVGEKPEGQSLRSEWTEQGKALEHPLGPFFLGNAGKEVKQKQAIAKPQKARSGDGPHRRGDFVSQTH